MKTLNVSSQTATITLNKADTAEHMAGEGWVLEHATERAEKMAARLGTCVVVETADGITLVSVDALN